MMDPAMGVGLVGLTIAATQVAKAHVPQLRGPWVAVFVAALAAALVAAHEFAPPSVMRAIEMWIAVLGTAMGSATLASKARKGSDE